MGDPYGVASPTSNVGDPYGVASPNNSASSSFEEEEEIPLVEKRPKPKKRPAKRKAQPDADTEAPGSPDEPPTKRQRTTARRVPMAGYKVDVEKTLLTFFPLWVKGTNRHIYAYRDDEGIRTTEAVVLANINFAGGIQTAWMLNFKTSSVSVIRDFPTEKRFVRIKSFDLPNIPSSAVCDVLSPFYHEGYDNHIGIRANGNSTTVIDLHFRDGYASDGNDQ